MGVAEHHAGRCRQLSDVCSLRCHRHDLPSLPRANLCALVISRRCPGHSRAMPHGPGDGFR